MFRRLAPFIAALTCASVVIQGQEKTPFTVRVDTRLVMQTVFVTDSEGKPIEDLTAEDFLLTEDGIPQAIRVFEFQKLEDTPIVRSLDPTVFIPIDGRDRPETVRIQAEAPAEIRYKDRRLLVLYFDMTSMSDSDRSRAISAAQTFVENQMSASDLVAIMTYSGNGVQVRGDFTGDPVALLQTILPLAAEKHADDIGVDFGQSGGEFNLFNTDRQLGALQTAVQMLGNLNERKSLVYFASGLRLGGVDNQAQFRATLNAARRANVAFYPVDSRGLVAMPPMGDASRPSPGGLGMYTGATAMASLRGFQRSQDALYTLAADTGGKALLDYNDLSLGIVAAQRATSSYYILGYYPTNDAPDGRLRRVKIELRNRAGTLAYRDAYYADKDFSRYTTAEKERQLEEAMMLGNPITDITIAMELNYFQLNSSEYFVPLAVKIPGNELVLAQKEGAEKTVVDFLFEVRDRYGLLLTNLRDKVEIKLKGETASLLASSPIQYDAGFTLLPGNYTIKFVARNEETGRIGTYQADFTIPNLNKELSRLPISSVVLSSQRIRMSDALFNTGKTREAREQIANPLIEDSQKLIPSVTRVFSKRREMLVYLQAYQRDAGAMRPLVAFVTFFRGSEQIHETQRFTVTTGMDAKSKAIPIKLSVPVNALEPGNYACHITVLDPTGEKAAFWQTPIRIVP